MIAVDTNILVYAHRNEFPQHRLAAEKIAMLSEGPWAIPWPCIHEFFSVITSHRLLSPPTSIRDAVAQVQTICEAPTLRLLHETDGHWNELRRLIESAKVTGRSIHDAKIAAICLQHGVGSYGPPIAIFHASPG